MKIFKFVPIFALLLLIGNSCQQTQLTVTPPCQTIVQSSTNQTLGITALATSSSQEIRIGN